MSRFVDRGAVVAGWIGVGTAVVVVVAFGLVLPIQPIVYIAALPIGGLIGWYANAKSERFRPRGRAVANALWAGLLTGLTLAVFYVAVRLIFVYADNGYPDFNVPAGPDRTASPTTCPSGPPCTYLRYLADRRGPELANAGVTDSASFTSYLLAEYANTSVLLFGLAFGGAALAGAWQAVRPLPREEEVAAPA